MLNDLTPNKQQIVFGDDSIVIQKYISGIKGGRTLDVTGFAESVIKAGHPIIVKDGIYAPYPLMGGTYAGGPMTLPSEAKFAGILYRSIPAAKPVASIMINGEVNSEAMPLSVVEAEQFAADCPHIVFIKDEEA